MKKLTIYYVLQIILSTFLSLIIIGISAISYSQEFPLGDFGLPEDYNDTIQIIEPSLRGFDLLEGELPTSFNWNNQAEVSGITC